MPKFGSGSHRRPAKYGGTSVDPPWIPAERPLVLGHCATIRAVIGTFIPVVNAECTQATVCLSMLTQRQAAEHATLSAVQRQTLAQDVNNASKWLQRSQKLLVLFTRMRTDLSPGSNAITFRKAMTFRVADEIMAITEFADSRTFKDPFRDPVMEPTWDVSLNANPADPLNFFAPANATEAQATLFHELTHLYGTEDRGVPDIENAYQLEGLLAGNATASLANLRSFLHRQRAFTMRGDKTRLVDVVGPITENRLKLFYGQDNVWTPQSFQRAFSVTGDPSNPVVTRRSDQSRGLISIYPDSSGAPLFYYDFR